MTAGVVVGAISGEASGVFVGLFSIGIVVLPVTSGADAVGAGDVQEESTKRKAIKAGAVFFAIMFSRSLLKFIRATGGCNMKSCQLYDFFYK